MEQLAPFGRTETAEMNRSNTASNEIGLAALALAGAGAMGVFAATQGPAVFLGLLAAAGAALVVIRPVLGLFLLTATIPLESALMVGGATAPRLVGMGVFGAWAVQKLIRREPLGALISPTLVQVAFLFVALACLSILWADYPATMPRRLVMLVQLVVLLVIVFDLSTSWDRLAWIARCLVLAGLVAAALTVEQAFVGGVRRAGEGIVGGINRTANTLVIIVPFAFYLLRSRGSRSWQLVGAAYLGLAALAIAATLSRTSFLLLAIVVAWHVLLFARTRGDRIRLLALGAVALLVIAFLPFDAVRARIDTIGPYVTGTLDTGASGETHTTRGFLFWSSLAMFQERPFLGVGYENFGYHLGLYQWEIPGAWRIFRETYESPHGSHHGMLANLGLIGGVLWISLFVLAFATLRRAWDQIDDRTSDGAFMVQALSVSIAVIFLYGIAGDVHQTKLFWLVLGMIAAAGVAKGPSAAGPMNLGRGRR